LSTNGFVAYDPLLDTEVLVMTVVLCHLGDSPMHAEITNTLNPSSSLSPCRICNLQAKSMMEKRTTKYICDFVGINEDGHQASLVSLTEHLWALAQRPGTIGLFDEESSKLGVKDTLNMFFLSNGDVSQLCRRLNEDFGEHLFNPFLRLKGFNGHLDTPVEMLHVILLGVTKYLLRNQMIRCSANEKSRISGRWRSFNSSGLNIPSIQPKTMINHFLSLNGKEFRTVIQAAPFIFLDCNLSSKERDVWNALAHLGPYLFQTQISDMKSYIISCNRLIIIFLQSIVRLSAQWCNKPKFHMLIHICDSIERFGPACLFATEKFEGYNGNTRFSLIHSNHLSPGRDIANSFNNHRLMRSVTAGSFLYDTNARTYIRASSKVINIFKSNTVFQRALGYNYLWNWVAKVQPDHTPGIIPKHIIDAYEAQDWKALVDIILTDGQKVKQDDFLSVLKKANSRAKVIGRVKQVWGVGGCGENQCKLQLSQCVIGEVSAFYGMREITETQECIWINPKDIESVLNVQHNCHDSGCDVQLMRPVVIERRLSKNLEHCVVHRDTTNFIINSGAFHSAELHWEWSDIAFVDVSLEEWQSALTEGLEQW
ncbi:hypothetical protein DFH28DRAFT_864089, partial [Melampsora americana]